MFTSSFLCLQGGRFGDNELSKEKIDNYLGFGNGDEVVLRFNPLLVLNI